MLEFLYRAIYPGRAHAGRFHSKTIGKKQHHHIRIDAEMREDARKWLDFLQQDNSAVCRPFVDFSVNSEEIKFFSDASGSAISGVLGCFFDGRWCYARWEDNFIQKDNPGIAYLELYARTVAVLLWSHLLENKRVVIFCDNEAIVHSVNKKSPPCRNSMKLIRLRMAKSLKHNVRYFCKYINTKRNLLADNLSRQNFKVFLGKRTQKHSTRA